jgi:DNA-binding NarL/FixJ family response regulator
MMHSEGRLPDVIVMDLQMAPIDGIETTRQIRTRYNDIEVVALTSFAEEERVHAALAAGASGYLLKDSDADDVAAAVRAAYRGELQLDPQVAQRLMSSLRHGPGDDPAAELTSRELEALRLVATGKANKQIAAELTSASERPVLMSPESSTSCASARAPRPRCARFAKVSWRSRPSGTSREGRPTSPP